MIGLCEFIPEFNKVEGKEPHTREEEIGKFAYYILVKNFTENLSKEIKKGVDEKRSTLIFKKIMAETW